MIEEKYDAQLTPFDIRVNTSFPRDETQTIESEKSVRDAPIFQ
jgi:hypothetical protein